MMDFIMVPAIIGIVTLGIYKLFELFVRKKERLNIIEKIGDKLSPSDLNLNFSLPALSENTGKFNTLKFACLLLGAGIGLLIGYFICLNTMPGFNTGDFLNNNYQTVSVIYGASVLTFGGLGLLIAFLVEMKFSKRKSGA